MSRTPPPLPDQNVDLSALLGVSTPPEPHDWGAIRATQLRAGRQLALFHLAAHLVGAALVAMIFSAHVRLWELGAWGAVTAAVACAVAFRRLASRNTTETGATAKDIRDTWHEGAALAAVWSVPPLAFTHADLGPAFGLWMVLSVLMTASAVALAPLAMSTLIFLLAIGVVVAGRLLLEQAFVLAGGTLLFTALLTIICLMRARSLVAIRAAQIALAERDETVSLLLREFEDSSADWLWETDAARRIVKAAPRFASACGLDPVAINGMPFVQVLAGPSWETGNFAPGLREFAEKLKGRDAFRGLCLPVIVAGQEHWWEMAASPRYDEQGAFMGFRGVSSDVTEQRASADKINRLARFDALTSLPNRLAINETLTRAMAEADRWGTRCAFMMIDLDRFKAVNDTLGHQIGDRLLQRVAERLGQLMGSDELIGRLGGDEFAVVVRDATDPDKVEKLARAIIEILTRPYEVDQHTLYIGASVGVATGPRDGRTAETLIRSADLALYRSKDAGGGVFHAYEPKLHLQAEERRVLEMALRNALANNEMHLAYQPVVDAHTGALTGFEALLRWTNPDFGNVSPGKFIPLAEETRLIAPIGEWALRSACEEAARWPDPIRVAVNVSPEQLHNPNFVALVAGTLAHSGLAPQRLELEVTESVFLREGTCAVQVLEKILDLGVRLSLDDFGTGYSSLGYLSRTRFSSIKIDRSFVQSASKGVREAIAIIRAVVALAKSLGMATTAEGVETEAEHRLVEDLGCTKVQGFYFGRPLPVAEARTLACQPRWGGASEAA